MAFVTILYVFDHRVKQSNAVNAPWLSLLIFASVVVDIFKPSTKLRLGMKWYMKNKSSRTYIYFKNKYCAVYKTSLGRNLFFFLLRFYIAKEVGSTFSLEWALYKGSDWPHIRSCNNSVLIQDTCNILKTIRKKRHDQFWDVYLFEEPAARNTLFIATKTERHLGNTTLVSLARKKKKKKWTPAERILGCCS